MKKIDISEIINLPVHDAVLKLRDEEFSKDNIEKILGLTRKQVDDYINTPIRKSIKRAINKKIDSKKLLTIDYLILDDSVSMFTKASATLEGVNKYITDLKELGQNIKANIKCSLQYFSSPGMNKIMYSYISSDKIELLKSYYPTGGSTALYDAIGVGIENIEDQLKSTKHYDGVDVVLTIFTDGEENSSKTHTRNSIKELIEKKKSEGWTINLIGAGSKLYIETEANKIGIFTSNTLNYTNDSKGVLTATASLSKSRKASAVSYSNTGVSDNIGFFQK